MYIRRGWVRRQRHAVEVFGFDLRAGGREEKESRQRRDVDNKNAPTPARRTHENENDEQIRGSSTRRHGV